MVRKNAYSQKHSDFGKLIALNQAAPSDGDNCFTQDMSRTDNISIVASLFGFLLAVYGIFTQPVVVESARPTQTGAGEATKAEVPAYARLWDDPFAVYRDIYEPHPPDPRIPRNSAKTLFLIIPTKTFAYEEDKENRLRIRYAVQRALFDHGFVARPGNLISTIDLTPCDGESNTSASIKSIRSGEDGVNATDDALSKKKISAPVEIFNESFWPTDPDGSRKPRFSAVAVVWLPDSYIWTANQSEPSPGNLWSALRQIKTRLARPEADQDEWILLGPSDSDALAFFEQYSNPLSGLPMKLSIVPYRATIAQPLLDRIVDRNSPFSFGADPRPNLQRSGSDKLATTLESKETSDAEPAVIRFPNGDDVLCLELLRAVTNHDVSLLPSKPLQVLVLAEWDTLYGRALAETFAALADRGNSPDTSDQEAYRKLKVGLSSRPDTKELLNRMEGGPPIKVRILPYLRGLDGASTLYRRAYAHSVSDDSGPTKSADALHQKANTAVEAAEGTTQFDYIRRLIESDYKERAPFVQRRSRPDAIIVFGTDVYDKLALLEFLRQELRNPLYRTTDLDALYWHPQYLKFTKNLVVASPFPLRMNMPWSRGRKARGTIMKSVEFRDIHQTAVYWGVCRCLDAREIGLQTFEPDSWPRLYQIGNTQPVPIQFVGEPAAKTLRAAQYFKWLGGTWPVQLAQGTSICCSLAFQVGVVLLGLWAVIRDIPSRVSLGQAVSEEVWYGAMIGLNDAIRTKVVNLRLRIKKKWLELNRRRPLSWLKETRAAQRVLQPARICLNRPIGEDLGQRLDQFEEQLSKVTSKAALSSFALELLSTLFCIQSANQQQRLKPSEFLNPRRLRGCLGGCLEILWINLARLVLKPQVRKVFRHGSGSRSNLSRIYLGLEIAPFAKFVARDLSMGPRIVAIYPKISSFLETFVKPMQWLDRRLPSWSFILVGVIVAPITIAICSNPTAYLAGPETLSTFWRTTRWLVETCALLVIGAAFHRVCYEHYRLRQLIKELVPLINERVAFSNRQLVVFLARASTPIANLALTPAALLFLIYLSHLPFLGGAPLTPEMLCLLLAALGVLAQSYGRLRSAALGAAEQVKSAYNQEASDATRFAVRLQSYVKRNRPVQDDETSLERGLQKLIENSSTSDAPSKLRPGDLRSAQIRNQCIEYLNRLEQRNRALVESVSEVRDGVFAPLISNPIVAALIIPLGGAGGINLIQWLVSFVR